MQDEKAYKTKALEYFVTDAITKTSAGQYRANICRWFRATGGTSMEDIVQQPTKYIAVAEKMVTDGVLSHASKKLMIACICALYKHQPDWVEKYGKHRQEWGDALTSSNKTEFEKVAHLQPTAKQLLNWVQWNEVVQLEKRLRATEYASDDHLLVAMYSVIEPVRADYGEMHVVIDDKQARKMNKKKANYIHITSVPGRTYFVLHDFKTVKAYGGRFWRYIPDDLVRIISANLEKNPREYLFTNRFNEPFGRTAFIRHVNDGWKRLFGKNVSISMIRHSFISNIDFNRTTPAQLMSISKNMLHSLSTQQLYRRTVTPPTVSVTLEGASGSHQGGAPAASLGAPEAFFVGVDHPTTAQTPVMTPEDAAKKERRRAKRREKRKRRNERIRALLEKEAQQQQAVPQQPMQQLQGFTVPPNRVVTI